MAKLKAGVIGLGMGYNHLRGYMTHPDVEVVAVADRQEGRRERAKQEFQIEKVYAEGIDLIRNEKLDILSVAVPNNQHKELTIAGLKAGAHVFCEKPMAMNAAEAEEMLATAKECNRQLGIDFSYRFTPQSRAMKALVEEGTTSSTPDQPSVQSGEEGYQKLNIPEELWNRFCTAEEYMSDMTMQSTASEETPEMQAIAAKREKLVQVCVRRVLESEDMPIEDEQEAAKKLKIVVSPYKGIYKKTVKEKISIVNGFLKDIKKEEYAEYVTTLKLDGYIAEIEQLHNQYCTLKKQRSSRQAEKPDDMTVEAQSKILQDALDDMNAYANATSLLEPSEETTKFILEVRNLFDETRAARNMRDSKRDDDETDEGEGDEPTEETPGEPTEETPGGDDDRPVVQ